MHPIEMAIVGLLDRAMREPVELSEDIIQEFGRSCAEALRRQLNRPQDPWTLRMSNADKPTCVLWHEQNGTVGESKSPWFRVQMLLGDLGEAVVIALMRGANVPIQAVQKSVRLELEGSTALSGTLDIVAMGKLYDIKTASPWSFANKFSAGFGALAEKDAFGYVGQLYGYAEAEGVPVGGWIALDKVTGQIVVCEAPDDDRIRLNALSRIRSNILTLASGKPADRCFEDEPEVFRKQKTGNRILGSTCGLCDFKHACWPNLRQLPQLPSSGASPKLFYYTHVSPEYEDKIND